MTWTNEMNAIGREDPIPSIGPVGGKRRLNIAVGLPHYGGKAEFQHTRMWMQFGHTLAFSEERFSLVCFALIDVCGIDRARNECVAAAKKADADWLLMIDADTWVSDGGDLLQMISDADKAGATIVGAAVRRRRELIDGASQILPRVFMAYTAGKELGEYVSISEARLKAGEFRAGEEGVEDYFSPVDAMATACMAINMRHVEFMDVPTFKFTNVESEDFDFCTRVREMRGGWMKLDDARKPSPNGVQVTWEGHILIDKRVKAFHLNRPQILEGL